MQLQILLHILNSLKEKIGNIFQLRLVSCEMTVYKNIEISWKLCTNNRPFLGTFQMENCILAQLTKYLRLTSFLKVFLQF